MLTILRSGLRKRSTKVGGTLTCPWCQSHKLKLRETFPPDREVWQCKMCGKRLTYVTSPMPVDDVERWHHKSEHPYKHIGHKIISKIPMIGAKRVPIIGKPKSINA